MTTPRISLCMIVKDEEEYLPGALASVREIVDEIVVVDTGSRDRSPDIARSFGASLIEMPWQNDFAAARNESMTHATGDWILILDADERLSARDHSRLLSLLSLTPQHAYLLPQWTYIMNSATVGWMPSPRDCEEASDYPGYVENHQVRLLPRRSGLCYDGAVHENLVASCAAIGLPVAVADIPVHHYGKVRSGEYMLRKAALYLELGVKKASSEQFDLRAIYELAVQLVEFNHLSEAKGLVERILEVKPQEVAAQHLLGLILTRQERLDDAVTVLKNVVDQAPDFSDAWNNLGVAYLHDKRSDSAITCLEKAVQSDPNNANAWGNLAMARTEREDLTGAFEAIRRAGSLNQRQAKTRLQEVVIRQKRGEVGQARELLAELAQGEVFFAPDDILHFCRLSHELDNLSNYREFLRGQFGAVSGDQEISMSIAYFLESMEHGEMAKELLDRVQSRYPEYAPASNLSGYILAREDAYSDALQHFTRALELNPNHSDYLKNAALACEKLGLTKHAVALYSRLASTNSMCADYSRERLLSIRRQSSSGAKTAQFVKVLH